jgi:hypothetical protein
MKVRTQQEQMSNNTQTEMSLVVIHRLFGGDMIRLNKDIPSEFQRVCFKTYIMKANVACQTSTYKDYLNLQSFLKKTEKMPFNLLAVNDYEPYRMGIKRIRPTSSLNWLYLGLAVSEGSSEGE